MSGLSQAASGMAYERSAPTMAYNDWAGRGLPCDGYYTPANGGGLPVNSISSISPTGFFLNSDNAFEGPVIVTGELPFSSAIVMEGNWGDGTNGAGVIQYGCGNGVVTMLSEGPAPTTPGSTRPDLYSPGSNVAFDSGSGFGSGLALGLGNGFGPVTGSGRSAGFANANRVAFGGCHCRMLY